MHSLQADWGFKYRLKAKLLCRIFGGFFHYKPISKIPNGENKASEHGESSHVNWTPLNLPHSSHVSLVVLQSSGIGSDLNWNSCIIAFSALQTKVTVNAQCMWTPVWGSCGAGWGFPAGLNRSLENGPPVSLPITDLLQLITVNQAISPPSPEGVISNLNPPLCLPVCMHLHVYFASLQIILRLLLCLLKPLWCPCWPHRVRVGLLAGCPSSEPLVRRTESGVLAAAGGAQNTSRIHRARWRWPTKPGVVVMQVEVQCRGTWQSSAPRPGTVWGGRERWRTPRLRRRGWSCTGPTGGSVTSHTERLCWKRASVHWDRLFLQRANRKGALIGSDQQEQRLN